VPELSTSTKRIFACTPVYNRAAITKLGIESLLRATLPPGYRLRLFVVDDKSTDATPQILRELVDAGAPLEIIAGTGELFWGGGLQLALEHAYRDSPEYVLWFNDDVQWDEDGLERMIDLAESTPNAIIAGTFRDSRDERRVLYGGIRRSSALRSLKFELARPSGQPTVVDTANGNGLLVARSIYQTLGAVRYAHVKGDFDYCLRASRQGIRTLVTGRTEGSCLSNPEKEAFLGKSTSYRSWWQGLDRPQNFPLGEWASFCREHVKPSALWPVYYLYMVGKLNLLWLRNRLTPTRHGSAAHKRLER
jgi:GT2 family glycosyltransferase